MGRGIGFFPQQNEHKIAIGNTKDSSVLASLLPLKRTRNKTKQADVKRPSF